MDIKSKLEESIGKENILIDENMSKHTTFRTGGKADFFVKINNIEGLKKVLNISKENDVPIYIIGNGSNILVTDKGIRGIVCQIKLEKFNINEELRETRSIQNEDILVTIGSGNKNAQIAQELAKMEIEGFEFASRNTRNASVEQ